LLCASLLGLTGEVQAQKVDFQCPAEEDGESGSCETGYVRECDEDAQKWACLYDGTTSYYADAVDDLGRTKRYKAAEGSA
jgi:hypothetical protein